MSLDFLIRALVGLMPVCVFLAALLYLDSYKLVKLRTVVFVILVGGCSAGVSYLVNLQVLAHTSVDIVALSRYVAPFVEEALKGAIIIWLIRRHRIGFLVDAAIFGFAVGAGFAMIENVYFLRILADESLGTWIVRGFGTAIMHGGATAIFAVAGLAMVDRSSRPSLPSFVPGFAVAALLHSAFNHFFLTPIVSTLGILVVLPPLLMAVFRISEQALSRWLGSGFDADTQMLELTNSGELTESPVGRYLNELRQKFEGPVVADLLCYLRLNTELALRAKGILMMREAGFAVPVDEETRAKFTEMRYLEDSIGKTGRRALQPMLRMTRKDLWQLYMLGK